MSVDDVTARLSMRIANRTTRRGVLAALGKAALVLAGGGLALRQSGIGVALHECGHTGLSPNCQNDFCPDVFGRCWYAADCCANGQIKKICDCCSPNYPNVHGYCPDGYNVRCIVTSCGRPPFDRRPAVVRVVNNQPESVAVSLARTLPGTDRVAVLAVPAGAPLDALIAPGLAHTLNANVYLARPGVVDEFVLSEMETRAIRDVWLLSDDSGVETQVRTRGMRVVRLPGRTPGERAAAAVYERGRRVPLLHGIVVDEPADEAHRWAVVSAASAAAALGMAFVMTPGGDHAPARSALLDAGVARTLVIGNSFDQSQVDAFPDARVLRLSADPPVASAGVIRALIAMAGRTPSGWMVVSGAPAEYPVAIAAAGTRLTLVTDGDSLPRVTFDVLEDHALAMTAAWLPGTFGAISDQVYMAVEDALKGYERDQFLGGEGTHLGPGRD